jgi:hypothetical protein
MDQTTQLLILVGVAVIGLVAVILIMRRERHTIEDEEREQPFAVSTEGMKRCPKCGFGNLVTDATCASCGKDLPG